jgi:hypothetical protein
MRYDLGMKTRTFFVVQYQTPDDDWWYCDRDIEMDTEAEAVGRMGFLRPNYKGALRVVKITETIEFAAGRLDVETEAALETGRAFLGELETVEARLGQAA